MRKNTVPLSGILTVQAGFVLAFATAYATMSPTSEQTFESVILQQPQYPEVEILRTEPLRVQPLYDDPEVVSDEELAAVLDKVQPRFDDRRELKPNYVEHALRTWGVKAKFRNSEVMSGEEMKNFLLDYGSYLASWGEETEPLQQLRPQGIAIRWGTERGASYHHDHMIACLTEAGVSLDEPVFAPGRQMTIREVLLESLRDFHLDEREVEWSAMAFGLWMPEQRTWITGDGRTLSFDLIAKRLMRGDLRFGVCSGTHRVYSLMLLWRINQEYPILSDPVREEVWAHLEKVRDLIIASQFEDGHWPSDWMRGAEAVRDPKEDEEYRSVIATGHHLEWLAIAPRELHPPHEQIRKAADWVIENTQAKSYEEIKEKYTFYSHVGSALALWRNTTPAEFWMKWEIDHPPAE